MSSLLKKMLICACAAVFALGAAGCGGVYEPPLNGDGGTGVTGPENPAPVNPTPDNPTPDNPTPDVPDPATPATKAFTVKLVQSGGSAFNEAVCADVCNMSAVWTNIDDSKDVISAEFGGNGEASAELDGDYRITLSSLPEGYTYDCNGHVANNESKVTEITMLPIKKPTGIIQTSVLGGGTGRIDWSNLRTVKTGEQDAYRITVKSGEEAKFRIKPGRQDVSYSITTICDVYANRVKPLFSCYVANSNSMAFFGKNPEIQAEVTTPSNSYTKNLKHVFTDTTGNDEFFFSVGAESKDGGEVTLDFIFRREPDAVKEMPHVAHTEWDFDAHEFSVPAGSIVMYGDAVSKDLNDDAVIRGDSLKAVLKGGEESGTEKVNKEAVKATLAISSDGDIDKNIDNGFYYLKATGEMLFVPLADSTHMSFIKENSTGTPLSYVQAELNILKNAHYSIFKNKYKQEYGGQDPVDIYEVPDGEERIIYKTLNYDKMIKTDYKNHLVSKCYPVNDELIAFLVDYSSSNMFFYDNTDGSQLENMPFNCTYCGRALSFEDSYHKTNCPYCGKRLTYASDKQSQWLASCCVFR